MKLKMGCAGAVLTFLCFGVVDGGALKSSFTKNAENVGEDQGSERPKIKEGVEEAVGTASDSAAVAETAKNEKADEKPSKTEKAEASEKKENVTPPSEKKKIVGNPVIFKIGQKEIRRDEILSDMKAMPPQLVQGTSPDKLFDLLKRQRLVSYLVVEQAKRAGLDRTKEYMDQLEKLKERLLFETYLMKEIGPKTENEAALKSKYQKYLIDFKGGKEVKLAHISVASEKEAKTIVDALAKGTNFDKLRKEKSSTPDDTSDRYFPLSMIPEDVRAKITPLKKGAHTEPIKIADSYHIFKLVDSRDMKPGSYEEVKPLMAQMVLKDELDNLISKLEKQFNVERFNEDGTPEVSK